MKKNNKICFILGTRPEIIKMYPLIKLAESKKVKFFIIHTNQHYDEKMDKIFFDELEIPQPTFNLNIGSGSHGKQTGEMMIKIEEVLQKENPDIVFVQGDTNTVLAGALVASKLGVKVGHIEAGLRSYDRSMPEEANRVVTDHISDYLFCPNKKQQEIILDEGISSEKVVVTGNTVVDAANLGLKTASKKMGILKQLNLEKNEYFLLTCHRPSNTDCEKNFKSIIQAISTICSEEKKICIFPIHPRLKHKKDYIESFKNIKCVDPVGYLDMLSLQQNSKMIFTDSGGIQEESAILHKKCLILRLNTERPESLLSGGAVLLKEISQKNIFEVYRSLEKIEPDWKISPFGNGDACERIFKFIGINV